MASIDQRTSTYSNSSISDNYILKGITHIAS